jgi:copper homeostasis protein
MRYKTEACIINLPEALQAMHHGADRLEVCSRIETEGMTPDVDMVREIISQTGLPVRVMIRETENGYEADDVVLEKMIEAIQAFKKINIEGFVIGLMKEGKVDRGKMEILFAHVQPFPITFHKAIDTSVDLLDDLTWINEQKTIDTILTSGGMPTALEGIDHILRMKSLLGNRIMPGGRITHENVDELHRVLRLEWYHGRHIV